MASALLASDLSHGLKRVNRVKPFSAVISFGVPNVPTPAHHNLGPGARAQSVTGSSHVMGDDLDRTSTHVRNTTTDGPVLTPPRSRPQGITNNAQSTPEIQGRGAEVVQGSTRATLPVGPSAPQGSLLYGNKCRSGSSAHHDTRRADHSLASDSANEERGTTGRGPVLMAKLLL